MKSINFLSTIQSIQKRVLKSQKKIFFISSLGNKHIYNIYKNRNMLITKQDRFKKNYRYVTRLKKIKMCSTRTYCVIQKRGFSGTDIVKEKIHLYSPKLISLKNTSS